MDDEDDEDAANGKTSFSHRFIVKVMLISIKTSKITFAILFNLLNYYFNYTLIA